MKRKNKMSTFAINNAMALRLPQFESLEILDTLMQELDLGADLHALEGHIHEQFPIFREFERAFPSLTFALATGVGKTRLTGAFITDLYVNYGIRNFFVVAPNLTVYNKLIQDFGNPAFSKYVFKGIQPFVQNPPLVITGDTYQQHVAGQSHLWEVTINIFNIGKINAEVRGDSVPLIKRLSEYIGQSYFDYLKNLPDLVLLMDESHHYRADRGMAVINELNPLLGLELTATPQVETSKGPVKFKNVVYEYSLAKAIRDGFVKNPAAATRRTFDPRTLTAEEIDRIKLIDGIRIHRNTAAELQSYAQNEGVRLVKPFVLVVCKDTTHAAEVRAYITSAEFYDGYYDGKVIELHSNQRGSEKDENIQRLIQLEDADNQIEIVIHVNMLKEGWDVTNLYTIIPLRTATSMTLREQTLGRGLRLPYGKITGNTAVDRLTIVAHDKFEELINAAQDEHSILRQENIIVIDEDEDQGREKEVVRQKTMLDDYIEQKEKNLKFARSEEKKQAIVADIETSKAVGQVIEELLSKPVNLSVPLRSNDDIPESTTSEPQTRTAFRFITSRDLGRPEVQALIKERAKEKLEANPQLSFIDSGIEQRIESVIAPTIEQTVKGTIDIPDIALVSKGAGKIIYSDFVLDTRFWPEYIAPSDDIVIESLSDNETELLYGDAFFSMPDSPENLLLGEILNAEPLIDYDENSDRLYEVIRQALTYIALHNTEQNIGKATLYYKKDIAKRIIEQMSEHAKLSEPEYEIKLLRLSMPILRGENTKFKEDDIVPYAQNIPAYAIRKKMVGGFAKACHDCYKFDSVPEHIFSIILERSHGVEKWLRPAPRQFKITWQAGRNYEPDFLVETADGIYIVEIKAYNRVEDDEVKLKAKAARAYCAHVNTALAGSGRKPWKYLLFEDRQIERKDAFEDLLHEAVKYSQV